MNDCIFLNGDGQVISSFVQKASHGMTACRQIHVRIRMRADVQSRIAAGMEAAADDIIAGVQANLITQLIVYIINYYN